MTKEQAKKFIEEVLGGLWSRWEPKKEEMDGWIDRLLYFDYASARIAVSNSFFEANIRGVEPPAGKILNAIRKSQQRSGRQKKGEPVLLYTIIKESLFNAGKNYRIYGKGFYVGNPGQIPAPQETERRAERDRQWASQMYAENHIIIRNWENL